MPSTTLVALQFGGDVGTPFMSGLVSGSIYGLVALGIVLIYKSNRIFNFAQAEFGSVAGIIALSFVFGLGPFPKLPYFFAGVLGVVAGTLTGLATERLVIRPLFDAPRATLLVATAGVALFCIGMELVLLGTGTLHVLPRPGGAPHFSLFGSRDSAGSFVFGWAEIDAVLAFVVLAAAAAVFFRTRYGVAILAVSQEPTAAGVVGIDVRRISALTWGIAGFLGGVAGVLYAPLTGATAPGFFTDPYGAGPLIYGFIAAVIGGTTSLPGAMVGGLLVGEINAFASNYVPKIVPSLPGSGDVTLALLLLLVLLVRPVGLLGQET